MIEKNDVEKLRGDFPPSLYLLLSVDIVGSTSYKMQAVIDEKSESWMTFFKDFADSIPNELKKQIQLVNSICNSETLCPKILKSLGDELIFYIQLTKSEEAGIIIESFRTAIRNYSMISRKGTKGQGTLGYKCTAWLVGVPVGNMVLTNNTVLDDGCSNVNDRVIDFIGPQVDIGFRIAKYASRQKFVISPDLAYLLSKIPEPGNKSDGIKDMDLYFLGKYNLKGVLKNEKYPIFYIDAKYICNEQEEFEGLQKDFDKEKKWGKKGKEDIINYYNDFFDKYTKCFIKPFIEGDKYIGEKPEGYDSKWNKIVKAVSVDYEISGLHTESGEKLLTEDGDNLVLESEDKEEEVENLLNKFHNDSKNSNDLK